MNIKLTRSERSGDPGTPGLRRLRRFYLIAIVGLLPITLCSQVKTDDVCRIEDGKVIFRLDPHWTAQQIGRIARQYDLDSTMIVQIIGGLPQIIIDSVTWNAHKLADGMIELSKATDDLAGFDPLEKFFVFLEDLRHQAGVSPLPDTYLYGINRFTKPGLFDYRDSIVTLTLPGYGWAKTVMLSGTFNDWSTGTTSMNRTETGWTIQLRLPPGHYPYKYIIDGRWTQDPNNSNREDDLAGGNNSVFYCYNHLFQLDGYTDARRVILAGSFNGFNPRELEMLRTDSGWMLPMFLATGTHSYKFIVDGRWMTDPANPLIRGDGRGNQNSFMSIGDTLFFRVDAFQHAQQVELAGSFNNWQWGELLMEKTETGWELPYVLPAGNHEYKFIVDGQWTTDPDNPLLTGSGDYVNSVRVVRPTHQFTLEGFSNAREVIVTGSFYGWREDAYRMVYHNGKWQFPLYLNPGKHLYKLIVDGNWILDPGNSLWEDNEYGNGNSVLWVH